MQSVSMSSSICTSQMDKSIIVFNGYRYRRDKIHQSSVSWRCCKRDCRGRLILYTNDGTKRPTTAHNHAPDPAEVDACIVKNRMKEEASQTDKSPRDIIHSAVRNASTEACVRLPSYDSARRTIQRQRNSSQTRSSAVNSITDIIIDEKLQKTSRGEMFLLWDSGSNDANRIIMFGTRNNIDILQEFRHWCVDGTFKVAPKFFCQMFTIHSLVDGKAVPLIYALLCNKAEQTYVRVFRKLKEIEPLLEPATVMSDFESASLNAIREVFPSSELVGCFFHLAQNLWRKIQQSKLTDMYRSEEDIRIKVKQLLALSFVPIRDVQFAFEIITEEYPEQLKPIVHYWESSYVGKRINGIEPRFPIALWNMFERVSGNMPKNNNSLEAWHNSFQKALDCQHPSVFRLIDRLIKEQGFIETQMSRYRSGFRATIRANSKYEQQKRRLKVLISQYSFREVKAYLQAVALNLTI